jgi:hypothetical protein
MSRPPLEVADLIRSAGAAFIERNRQWLSWKHIKVLLAIARCRTAALGGHLDQCTRCGQRATISYNSCRNRHCPKCQNAARFHNLFNSGGLLPCSAAQPRRVSTPHLPSIEFA